MIARAERLENVAKELALTLNKPEAIRLMSRPPATSEWSVVQILGHMLEMIPYWRHQCQVLILATGETPNFGRNLDDPERLVGVAQGEQLQFQELMERLQNEIRQTALSIRQMSEVDLNKRGYSKRWGELTVEEIIEKCLVSHAEEHMAQVKQALDK